MPDFDADINNDTRSSRALEYTLHSKGIALRKGPLEGTREYDARIVEEQDARIPKSSRSSAVPSAAIVIAAREEVKGGSYKVSRFSGRRDHITLAAIKCKRR